MLFNKSLATFGRYLMLMGRTFSRPEMKSFSWSSSITPRVLTASESSS